MHYIARVNDGDVEVQLFNDGKVNRPSFKREHLVHCQLVGVYGVSETMFSQDYHIWEGKGDICFKTKGKKKVTFTGRDIGVDTEFEDNAVVTTDGIFTGTEKLTDERPPADIKLTPLKCENRTIIG